MWSLSILSLALAQLLLPMANAFGYISTPSSRQNSCAKRKVDAKLCDGAQYEPQSVEALKGAPFQRDVGPHLCNGGSYRFDALNSQSPTLWPKTNISSGSDIVVNWQMTAVPPGGSKFDYYITRTDWDQSKQAPLLKDDFEPLPALTTFGAPGYGNQVVTHVIPANKVAGRSGYAVIYGVNEVADTPNAFYNCVDVVFTTAGASESDLDSGLYVQGDL